MISVHYYDPWDFAGQEDGTITQWGAGATNPAKKSVWGQEDFLDGQLKKMYDKFVTRGYPVFVGEYGSIDKTTYDSANNRYRADYARAVVATAKKYGAATAYWDNGWNGQHGFGLFNRSSATVTQQGIIDAIMSAVGGSQPTTPPTTAAHHAADHPAHHAADDQPRRHRHLPGQQRGQRVEHRPDQQHHHHQHRHHRHQRLDPGLHPGRRTDHRLRLERQLLPDQRHGDRDQRQLQRRPPAGRLGHHRLPGQPHRQRRRPHRLQTQRHHLQLTHHDGPAPLQRSRPVVRGPPAG